MFLSSERRRKLKSKPPSVFDGTLGARNNPKPAESARSVHSGGRCVSASVTRGPPQHPQSSVFRDASASNVPAWVETLRQLPESAARLCSSSSAAVFICADVLIAARV